MQFAKIILTYIVLLSSCNTQKVQTNVKLDFESDVQKWLTENNVPAAGVGIIENGKIKYAKVFGELKKGTSAPDNTIFNVASLTKPVVAMLTLKLVENEQWSLDEPLFHYWIDPDVQDDSHLANLTTRHVLSHQTGFPNWRRMNPSRKLSFEFAPGTDFKYSGEGFEYLRRAMEIKFKKSFAQISDSVLFEPLGMKDSRFYWDADMDESRFALWHNYKGDLHKRSTSRGISINAAGSLLTTIEDYCKFGIDVINGAGLSEDILKEMITPSNDLTNNFKLGLCWEIVSDLPGEEYALVHKGTDNGVNTIILLLPESKRGVIVFTNGDNGGSISENVIKASLGEALFDSMYKISNMPEKVTLSDEILRKYMGEYIDQYGRDLNISPSNEKGSIKVAGDGIGTFVLYPESQAKFFNEYSEIRYEFIADETGLIVKLNKILEGRVISNAKRIK